MFTKQTDIPCHLCVLQIPNLPAWSLHEPSIDLYVVAFIRRTQWRNWRWRTRGRAAPLPS